MSVPGMSRAAVVESYGGAELIKVHSRTTPVPASGELLIEVHAAGVNLVDTLFREGYLNTGPLPLTLGSDFAGVVADPGDVQGFTKGQEVYGYKLLGNGTYAEHAAMDAALVAPMPRSLSFIEAAAIPCAGLVAYDAIVNTLALQPGETILIGGAAGGVGHLAVQIAKAQGATVIATASAANREFVRSLGADHVIDYARDVPAAVFELFPGGVDAALPTVTEAEPSALRATRDFGRITWINNAFTLPLERGISGGETNGSHGRELLDGLTRLIDRDAVKVHVAHVYTLGEAALAQTTVAEGHTRGKLVIDTTR